MIASWARARPGCSLYTASTTASPTCAVQLSLLLSLHNPHQQLQEGGAGREVAGPGQRYLTQNCGRLAGWREDSTCTENMRQPGGLSQVLPPRPRPATCCRGMTARPGGSGVRPR